MLLLIWIALCLVIVSFILLLPAMWRREILNRYSGARPVTCPENRQSAVVGIDARSAATAEMDGRSDLRLCECTRWPERAGCAQACLMQAVRAEPYPPGKAKGTKQIYHLPIAVAAFAAWCLGAIWHAQYVFRGRWMEGIGLSRAEVKQMVWWLSPHLLTAGVCLLFAYGVAWLLALCHRKGVLNGLLMAALLCIAVLAASSYGLTRLPRDLVRMELEYLVLATIIMGAIVGGLYDKLVLPEEVGSAASAPPKVE